MADAPGERSDREAGARDPDGTSQPAPDAFRRKGEADAWNAFSLVVSGVVVWGGLGWLAGRALDLPALTGVGFVVGTAGGLGLVWLRYGRQT